LRLDVDLNHGGTVDRQETSNLRAQRGTTWDSVEAGGDVGGVLAQPAPVMRSDGAVPGGKIKEGTGGQGLSGDGLG
jgi:hypothetical protein